MGSAHDIMQTFAHRDLHALFPEYDGWRWEEIPLNGNSHPAFRVSRNASFQYQSACLSVSLDPEPSAEQVAALESLPRERNGFKGLFLLVPQGADVSGVPREIRVLTMTSFGFTGGKLTWLSKKKNAARYPHREGVPA